MRDREDKTILTQRDSDRRVGERLHDVSHWRSELQVNPIILSIQPSLKIHTFSIYLKLLMFSIFLKAELERNTNENNHLMRTRSELTKALQETEGPLKVTSECLYKREGRRVCSK